MPAPKYHKTARSVPKKKTATVGKLGPDQLQKIFDQAVQFHVNNELEKAQTLYEQILSVRANDFNALHYLGVIHYQKAELAQALIWIQRALKLDPLHSVGHSNLGNVLQSLNQHPQAVASYTAAIVLNPQFADAYFNLGVVRSTAKQANAALACYSRALVLNPAMAVAHNNKGLLLQDTHSVEGLQGACLEFAAALRVNPAFPQALFNWGTALQALGDKAEALKKYNAAIELDPNFSMALNNRGNLLQEAGQYEAALQSFTFAMQANPLLDEAAYNRGSLFQTYAEYARALEDYSTAVRINPNNVVAFFNRGSVHEQLKAFTHARADFERATALQENFADAHFNLSLLLLKLGCFDQGWQAYEWRWRTQDFEPRYLKSSKPKWQPNHPATGVLVWNEQGVGDDIFFLPWGHIFWTLLCKKNGNKIRLIYRVDARLLTLFNRAYPDFEFISHDALLSDDQYDAHLPAGSLPLAIMQLGADPQVLRSATKFLRARDIPSAPKPLHSAPLVTGSLAPIVIGISWRSQNSKTGQSRSLVLEDFVKTLEAFNVCLVNLQYGEVSAELGAIEQLGLRGVECAAGIDVKNDFEGLSSLISACDLVISADNTTVHLSGALGKKTWILLPYTADWRWGTEGERSQWYESVELFRQNKRGDWAGVLGELSVKLNSLIERS